MFAMNDENWFVHVKVMCDDKRALFETQCSDQIIIRHSELHIVNFILYCTV